MTGEVCHGGGAEYTKWNRASRHWRKVKLERTTWQRWRVQCSLLIWGLSLVGGCWENKMGIQGAVDRQKGERLQVCSWQVCVVVRRQGDSSESHCAAQRRSADGGAGPGGGRGFQGKLFSFLLHLHICPLFGMSFSPSPSIIHVLCCLSTVKKNTVLTLSYFLHQGSYSNHNNEDLVQKGKQACSTDFLSLCWHIEKKINHLPKAGNDWHSLERSLAPCIQRRFPIAS